jgi:phage baseplate assembly protein W|tara:strand:- start:432 stop:833 length:402 start_codon:yes stop_codon:yes gene_type:complete
MANINRVVRRYTDLNLIFSPHPYSKDVLTRKNIDAVKASVQNLILTKNYERPFHPEIGSQVNNLMFENMMPSTIAALEKSITDTIDKFEPRAKILKINIVDNSDTNAIDIEVMFALNNVSEPVTVTTTINRVR